MKRAGWIAAVLLVVFCVLLWRINEQIHIHQQGAQDRVARLQVQMEATPEETLRLQENLTLWYHQLGCGQNSEAAQSAYSGILCYSDGAMGIIEFPSGGISLPICHGEEIPDFGLGHDPASGFPTGDPGMVTVLFGQTGMADGSLLFDISDLQPGDEFRIHILGRILTYRVEQRWETAEKTADVTGLNDESSCILMIRDGECWMVIVGILQL